MIKRLCYISHFKVVATTLRKVKTATINDWSAMCSDGKNFYKAKDYDDLEIFDRVGGGDSFASGFIYGIMTTKNIEKAVEYGGSSRRTGNDNTWRYIHG